VSVVGISVDDAEDSRAMASELRIGFPLLSDPTLEVAARYGVAMRGRDIAVPSVFIVDREGRVVFSKIGENVVDRPTTEQLLERATAAARASASP
jgi:peroxiredoxin